MAKVRVAEGKILEIEDGIAVGELARRVQPSVGKEAIAAEVNGEIVDLSTSINPTNILLIYFNAFIQARQPHIAP